MACLLDALCIDANNPIRLSHFWGGLLGGATTNDASDGIVLLPADATAFPLRFLPTPEPKNAPNRMHFDLTSTSPAHQERTVARSLELGARHIDIGQRPEEDHVVLADPEGNEFCVIESGNRFLADCGFIGALACDGSQAVGYFWSKALGWPLVWDQDQETAIQSPLGGPKITWGGPPVRAKVSRNRMHIDLAPALPHDQQTEVNRLVSLGATRIDGDPAEDGRVVMADPDDNEFGVLASR
jgi:hypothetical protein